MTEILKLASIRLDGGTQLRAETDQDTIDRYAQDMLAGDVFPPVVVYHDETDHWLSDGFHRYLATQIAGKDEIETDVRQGTLRDAILHAAEANRKHGLPLSNKDKRQVAELFLSDPEWAQWSDREIARRTGLSNRFVSTMRRELSVNGSQMERKVERNGTAYTLDITNIGVSRSPEASAEDSEVKLLETLKQELAAASSLAEIKDIADRSAEMQAFYAERAVRYGRRIGELLQEPQNDECTSYVPVDIVIARSVAEAKGHDESERARRLLAAAQDTIGLGKELAEAAKLLDRNQFLAWAKVEFLMDEQDVDELMANAEKYKDRDLDGLSVDEHFEIAGAFASWFLDRYTSPERQATRSLMNYYQLLMKSVSDMPEFHEKTKIVPAMQPGEYARLVYSIHHYGQALPITTFKGKIIDGRMRYLACRDAGRLPRLKEWEGDESKVLDYIISMNFKRSHLTEDQKAMVLVQAQELAARRSKSS